MTLTRGFIRNAATTPLDARLMDMASVVSNVDGSPRTGVLGGANLSIVSTLATMNVAVAAAEFVASKGKADGVSIFTNDGVVNVPITAAPVSNSRIDVIWVKHEDNTTGDAASLPIFGVTAGVAGAVPAKPAIPTGCLELATLRVYSGTTATNGGSNLLTNTYQMTAARGGVVPFRTKTDLDAWTTATIGQLAEVRADASAWNNGQWRYNGAAWNFTIGPRVAFTPTWSGLVLGTSSNVGWWQRCGDRIVGEVHVTLNTGWNMATYARFTPPTNLASPVDTCVGTAVFVDNGTGYVQGTLLNSAGSLTPLYLSGSPASLLTVTNPVPFAWTVTDAMHLTLDYAVA